jgi:hypothetical protein
MILERKEEMKKKLSPLTLTILVVSLSLAGVLTLLWTVSSVASAPQLVDNPSAGGPPPTMVNYQGTITEDGVIFDGTGYFKFAIVDSPTGDGTNVYWAHDGSTSLPPSTYITRTVDNGLFNVMLGDTSVTSMTQSINHTVFNTTNTYLRVWFSDTPSGFQALEPNQQFASVAYALHCTYAESASETDPVFSASPASGITNPQINHWNLAWGWGDHSLAGYDTTDDKWSNTPVLDVYVPSGNVGIGLNNPATLLHIKDASGAASPQFVIENTGAGGGNAYQTYTFAATNYSTGIDSADGNYKTTNTNNLTGGILSTQGDGVTMLQAYKNGILDFNNQSRARAWLNHPQFVGPGAWIPIEFDMVNFDQQAEFVPSPGPGIPGFFIATVQGYYQIHARTDFTGDIPDYLPNGYVSIAIFVTNAAGLSTMYAQGNNLQMVAGMEYLPMNNAPNVSDVVWLNPGDRVDIRVWQSFTPALAFLGIGPSQTYVSIHKDS